MRETQTPPKQHVFGKRITKRATEIDHHLGNSLFSRPYPAPVRLQSHLFPNGGLHGGSTQNFTFNFRGGQRLAAHRFNCQSILHLASEVHDCNRRDTIADQELLLRGLEEATVPRKNRSVWLLPIACHER